MSRYSISKFRAFTLLEVLIALMVLATALIALSGTMNQATRTQLHQKNKTLAHYVAMYRLGELKLEDPWPSIGTTRGSIKMLNREWSWQQEVIKTSEDTLRRIEISVGTKDDEDYKLTKIVAFFAQPEQRVP
jgi:general secretion pathway protein I